MCPPGPDLSKYKKYKDWKHWRGRVHHARRYVQERMPDITLPGESLIDAPVSRFHPLPVLPVFAPIPAYSEPQLLRGPPRTVHPDEMPTPPPPH